MSGAASLSAAKRRRSGGANNQNVSSHNVQSANMQQSNMQTTQQLNQPVRLARTSNNAEAINIHDQILVETIKQINSHASQFTNVNETLKKIGNNENGIHERLLKVEELLNKLLETGTDNASGGADGSGAGAGAGASGAGAGEGAGASGADSEEAGAGEGASEAESKKSTSPQKNDVGTIKTEVSSEITETLKKATDNNQEKPTQGSYRKNKRGKKNNVSLTIEGA